MQSAKQILDSELFKKQLIQLVIKEASGLKIFATEDELNKLNLPTLDPKFYLDCIYGQMTGNCYSDRATELINKCCINGLYLNLYTFGGNNFLIPEKTRYSVQTGNDNTNYFSPIEIFVIEYPDHIPKLIDYLQDKNNDLLDVVL